MIGNRNFIFCFPNGFYNTTVYFQFLRQLIINLKRNFLELQHYTISQTVITHRAMHLRFNINMMPLSSTMPQWLVVLSVIQQVSDGFVSIGPKLRGYSF